jgi:murein DD-endopeptidase MepM/ murein hydrolase activator NlpD
MMTTENRGSLSLFARQTVQVEKAEALGAGVPGKDKAGRQKAAQEFAALLFLEVLKAMRSASPEGGFSENDGLSRDIYTSMFDTEAARLMAKRDVTGFTKAIEKTLDKLSDKGAIQAIPTKAPAAGAAEKKSSSAVLPQSLSGQAMPALGEVSSLFGPRRDPFAGVTRLHQGIDIAAPAGAPVTAAAGGKVVFSGAAGGYGNMVEIAHDNGLVTRYAHNATNLVARGDEVRLGQSIALVGSTGRATGAHLHFEVRRDGKPIDPMIFWGGFSKGSKLSTAV